MFLVQGALKRDTGTCREASPTAAVRGSSKPLSASYAASRSMPRGFNTAAHACRLARKTGEDAIRSRPMRGHWLPLPGSGKGKEASARFGLRA